MANTPNVPENIAFQPRQIDNSVVEQLQRQKQRDEAAAQRYRQSLNQNGDVMIRNAERGIEAARMYGEDVKKLTQFSQTLTNFFVEQQQQKNQQDMEEGMALAFTEGVPVEEQVALEEREAQLNAEDLQTQNAAGRAYEATGSYEVATRVRDLSGWRGYGYSIGRAQVAGSEYGAWLSDKINGSEATSLAELQSEVAQWRNEYMGQYGGVPVALLNKYMFPGMREAERKLVLKKQLNFAAEQSDRDAVTAKATFMGDKMLAPLITRLASTLGPDGEMLGYKKARQQAQQILSDGIRAGTITADEVRAMGEQQVPVEWGLGKNKTFNSLFKTLIQGSIRDARQIQRSEDSFQRTEKKRLAQERVNEIAAEIADNSGMYSKEDIDTLLQEIQSDPDLVGVNTSLIEQFSRTYTSDAQILSKQRGRLEALASSGLLRPYHLNGVPWKLQQEFGPTATTQAQAAGPKGNFEDQMKAIKGTVTRSRNEINGDGSVTISTQAVITELQSMFRTRVAEKINQGLSPQQAALEAMSDVNDYFNSQVADESGRYYKEAGRDNMLRILQQNSRKSKSTSEINRFDAAVATKGSVEQVIDSGEYLTPEELSNNEKLWGTSEWKLPGLVQHIVDTAGLDPLETLNKFRAVYGLEPLVSPAAAASQGMTENGKKLLNRWRSSMRTTRAYSSEVMSWDPTRHKYGAEIDTAAQQSGIEPALIAAMAEIESTNDPNAVSPTGALGLMQIQPDSHPGYKGGMDVQQNLNYGSQYFAQLIQKYGGNIDHAVAAYNMGPNGFDRVLAGQATLPEETKNHIKKFQIALSKYQPNLNNEATMRGQFEVVQIVSTDPRYQGDDDSSTVYDPSGHGGDAMHQHYEFRTREQAMLAKKLYEKRGFRVTSYVRPGDTGAHGKGFAIDVAPPLDLPRNGSAEMAWIDKANAVIGY